MATVRYTRSAQDDLLSIWQFVAQDSLAAADNILEVIEREASLLAQQPHLGRVRPELGVAVRSWTTSTPYIVFYTIIGGDIFVLRVLHHARDVQTLN